MKDFNSEEMQIMQLPPFMLVAPVSIANPSNRGTKEGCSSPICSPEARNDLQKIIQQVSIKPGKMGGQKFMFIHSSLA